MIRLLLMLATALGVVWLLGRVDVEELRADPVGAIVGQLHVVSPLAREPKPRGEVVIPPPPFREEEPQADSPERPAEPPLARPAPTEPAASPSRARLDSDTTRRIHGRLDRVMGLAHGGGG